MSVESPISVSIISRGESARVETAAFLVMMAIALWIESPVIDLLSTTTTLGRSHQALGEIRRFALLMMGLVTALHAAVALTPLYDMVVRGILQTPPDVAEAMRIPLAIMIPWSAAIGWRRWRQGAMIRQGHTHAITLGTILRMLTIGGAGYGLLVFSPLTGLESAATALVTSVIVEALFIHFAARRALAQIEAIPEDGEPLTQRQLWGFHMPLTGSTLVMLTSTPIVGAALARVQDPVLQMAAWQVATALSFNFRVATFGLTELVIALGKDEQAAGMIRRFCLTLGTGLALLMIVCWATGFDLWFFRNVLQADVATLEWARWGFLAGVVFPFMGGFLGYLKGRLTRERLVMARLYGILMGVTTLCVALTLGVQSTIPGVFVAAGSIFVAQIAEVSVYAIAWRRHKRQRSASTPEISAVS